MGDRFPIYILSKGRAQYRGHFGHYLTKYGKPFRVVVEDTEADEYAKVFGSKNLLVLPSGFRNGYKTEHPDLMPKGSGPARNYVWEHAAENGHAWHWLFDDNINYLFSWMPDGRRPLRGREWFDYPESLTDRLANVGILSAMYDMFAIGPMKSAHAPLYITHAMSGMLIRTDMPIRWEGVYNEDIDLSLRCAYKGIVPAQMRQRLIRKVGTQLVKGGNTDTIYINGTALKSASLAMRHPKYVTLTDGSNASMSRNPRPHHKVDWKAVIKDYGLQIRVK